MNRSNLQRLAEERITDAETLLAASRWSGAYYLAGYSLECALKSCILAYVEQSGVIFVDKRYSEKCWTHDVEQLVKYAELNVELESAMKANQNFAISWQIAKNWSELSRYNFANQIDAESLMKAISDPANGVLKWAKQFW